MYCTVGGTTSIHVLLKLRMAAFPRLTDVTLDNVRPEPDDGDDALLDDPLALERQRGARQADAVAAFSQERPAHVSEETHKLVCATMAGGAALGERRRLRDAEVEKLRQRRIEALKHDAPLVPTAGDARAMLEAVAEADVATPVLVHVFSRTYASRRVDRALALLAARQARRPGDCRFVGACAPAIVRLDGDTIKSFPAFGLEIDEARLPALLVYRARALVRAEFAADVADADAVEDLLDGCL